VLHASPSSPIARARPASIARSSVGACRLCKLLFWDRSGFVLVTKRLESGLFSLPKDVPPGANQLEVELADLLLLLEGIDLAGAKRRPRWQPETLTSF